jgi:glycosyltransferase involved in cell wall biosynthesis
MRFTNNNNKSLLIMGTRGVPAVHGGFETFAERLALYLTGKGWLVTVYCQREANDKLLSKPQINIWNGVRRIIISTSIDGPLGTIAFDWACVRHAMGEPGLPLVLGYNTALFSVLLRLMGRSMLMNMDGIEWKRAKWGPLAKAWLYLNEWCGALFSSKLIADHPAIADHLAHRRSRKHIVTIAYGADAVTTAPEEPVRAMGLTPKKYFLSIGRIEPENSTLEMISAFVTRKSDCAFVCIGKLEPKHNSYHAAVVAAANGKVIFPGAIYEQTRVQALRFHALAYCHGHTVGGTNPSLVEALGAGNAIIAHDNRFNREVAGEGALYFSDVSSCINAFSRAEVDEVWKNSSREHARQRFVGNYSWATILRQYEELCLSFCMTAETEAPVTMRPQP